MSEDWNTTNCSEPRSLPKKPRILRGSQQTANPNTMAMAISKIFFCLLTRWTSLFINRSPSVFWSLSFKRITEQRMVSVEKGIVLKMICSFLPHDRMILFHIKMFIPYLQAVLSLCFAKLYRDGGGKEQPALLAVYGFGGGEKNIHLFCS